jgi:hypothetical protein
VAKLGGMPTLVEKLDTLRAHKAASIASRAWGKSDGRLGGLGGSGRKGETRQGKMQDKAKGKVQKAKVGWSGAKHGSFVAGCVGLHGQTYTFAFCLLHFAFCLASSSALPTALCPPCLVLSSTLATAFCRSLPSGKPAQKVEQ